jgi:hypothetical protein
LISVIVSISQLTHGIKGNYQALGGLALPCQPNENCLDSDNDAAQALIFTRATSGHDKTLADRVKQPN